jgi:sortase A
MITYPYHYSYHKSPTEFVPKILSATGRPKSKWPFRLIPPTLITIGSIMIANVLWPLIEYQFITSPSLQRPTLISPIALELLGSQLTYKSASTADAVTPQVLGETFDYTDPQTWFPEAPFTASNLKPTSYLLDIPDINIKNAIVYVGGHDLGQGLVQYPGTGEPGNYGSPVIFGHSVLRQFYNPSPQNPRRYLSIFSKIMTLKKGSRLYLQYNGNHYTYEVKDKYEVQPEDLDVLTQSLNTKELKLITCVPEGTYLRRGVIDAQLVDVNPGDATNVIQETGL